MTSTPAPAAPARKRQCFIIQAGQRDEEGYIPSLVTEGEGGHTPLTGDPTKLQTPWHWGKTFEAAKAACARQNASLGLSADDVVDIVASSIAAPAPATPDPMAVYAAARRLGGFFDCDDVLYCEGECGRSWPVGMTYGDAHVQRAVIADLEAHRTGCGGR